MTQQIIFRKLIVTNVSCSYNLNNNFFFIHFAYCPIFMSFFSSEFFLGSIMDMFKLFLQDASDKSSIVKT